MKTVCCVFGTRPEAIKMAPVVLKLREHPREFRAHVVVTAQHRGMLDQVLALFRIRSHADLNIMRDGQTLTDVSVAALEKLEAVFKTRKPDLVLVHGDTTTTLFAALAAFYQKIPVGHVEAGLRSFDPRNPFPEEINRRLADAACALHFAPTASARRNLLKENIPPKGIFVTGNTGIDALRIGVKRLKAGAFPLPARALRALAEDPFVLVTAHRRENFGRPLEEIYRALRRAAQARPGVHFVYPVHPNPNVLKPARALLSGQANIQLLPPLDYADLLFLLQKALFVVTDSGGLQEEAPSLGKPVLVLRRVTERPEAVRAGTARVVGTDSREVEKWILRLLQKGEAFRRMANAVNPYGDGRAAERTVEAIRYHFGLRPGRPKEFGGGSR
ncbi:MAG: UDP-N-acetylglucosamine 2-epimerase (non-hydrolyzing) [Elusimicrobia bacterium]|nr:UDP-N-acetylglucosamine 2-epimerase (non-hydrolyzing) [Elusimicrobiota bacterium]